MQYTIISVFLTWILLVVAGGCNERPSASRPPTDKTNGEQSKTAKTSKTGASSTRTFKDVFNAQVAGRFYPKQPDVLRRQVSQFIETAGSSKALNNRDVAGIISPHAGYSYSGKVAGYAYGAIAGRDYNTVIVLALNHRSRARRAAVLNREAYRTPLGDVAIDKGIVAQLIGSHGDLFSSSETLFIDEHSLEVQLPFIQIALPRAKVVPIIISVPEPAQVVKISEALYRMLGTRSDILFVMSSDFSHHFPYETAVKYDTLNMMLLEKWRMEEWKSSASRIREGMCGYLPVLTFASLFENFPADKRLVSRLAYFNSGDTSGDKAHVVGYGALAFSLEQGMRNQTDSKKDFGPYTKEDRNTLMALAKASVKAAVAGSDKEAEVPDSPLLKEMGAAFVTLKKNGELRGCIGHVLARIPLFECVWDMAHAAAVNDTRFSPVTEAELPSLSFEISILTTPEPISADDVVVGRDGLIISRGFRSGLLLPQVPVEWEWDREQFLAHTCRKAGLPMDCWKDSSTEIKAFRAIVFGEEDL